MMRMRSRYDTMSVPPMSRVRPFVSGTARQRARYSMTLRTAIGCDSVLTHRGVTITGRGSTR